ncbi:MAG TPA: hypothetical protein VHP11_13920 [Tepidisphaeraceae bacterium]|nr:hypothetical protein [Tepidisphaeraceae bacterium]
MSEVRPPQPGMAPGIRPLTPTPSSNSAPATPSKITIPIQPTAKPHDLNGDPISLVDDAGKAGSSKIKSISSGGPHMGSTHTFKRQPNVTGQGAVRVRSFHGRLSEEGMAFLDDKVNEWLDAHPEIEVKLVTTTIGQFEGKIRDAALVMQLWY